ncbi:hypothetical protein [Pseudarthrobacter oxydans]|uniref:hypothetical protein n=1 Tax=Pseudarthrobacter oxydans TaxID=1671 RepID=UPI0038098139
MSPEAVAAVVAALAAVVTLVWQISVHKNSGHKVHVKNSYITPVYEDMHLGDDDFIQVEVMNRGGKPVTVTNYAVGMGNRKSGTNMFVLRPPVWATALPAVAEPAGVPIKLLVPVSDLQKARHSKGIPFDKMTPWVELGDGRRIYSANPIPMAD